MRVIHVLFFFQLMYRRFLCVKNGFRTTQRSFSITSQMNEITKTQKTKYRSGSFHVYIYSICLYPAPPFFVR